MSVLNDVLTDMVTSIAALELTIGENALSVVKRKLPKREETVDSQYQVTVNGKEMVDQIRRIGFGSCWQVLYNIDITLVSPTERDMLYNLDAHIAWREAVRAHFMAPSPIAVEEVKLVVFIDSPFLDRTQLSDGYDYDQLTIQITTYERRL